MTFASLAQAEQAKRLIEATGADPARIAQHTAAAQREPTVTVAVDRHIEALTGVAMRTRADHRRDAERHIAPSIGAWAISAVDRDAVAAWINRLDSSGLADKTIANLHGLLSAALTGAVERGWLESNPCRGMRLPRRHHGEEEMTILTRSEWSLLLGEITPHWRPLFTFLVGAGARWGEASGLQVRHVDLLATPPIVQTDRRTPAGREIGPTKARRSRRTVTLPDPVVDALIPLTTRPGTDRLFVGHLGGPLHRSMYSQVWQPAVRRAADPARHGAAALTKTPRIHDLRHTHASWLIDDGVDLLTAARRLGHESITTTADVYGHLMPDQQARAAEAATRALIGHQPI